MNIKFYQAGCGDAARISFEGIDKQQHHMFVDSGWDETWEDLLKEDFKELSMVDVWIISHIHDDHIEGAKAYIEEVKGKTTEDIVQAWWYNPPRVESRAIKAIEPAVSQVSGIVNGDDLSKFLALRGKLPATDFTTATSPMEIQGLKCTFLSPSPERLVGLRTKYVSATVPLERLENQQVSSPSGGGRSDYHIKLNDFDLLNIPKDTSKENGSSISLLMERDGFSTLWLADAWAPDIVDSLKDKGYSAKQPLICDWIKIPHHGSRKNNSKDLYELIKSENYLISGDGLSGSKIPSKITLALILRNEHRIVKEEPVRFFFTHENPTLKKLFDCEDPGIFDDLNFSVYFLNGSTAVQVPVEKSHYFIQGQDAIKNEE